MSSGAGCQQPQWSDRVALAEVTARLAASPALVQAGDVRQLRACLANVALGNGLVIQAGDCAEDPAEQITECVYDSGQFGLVGERYTTCCDPRLNPGQALLVVSEWARCAVTRASTSPAVGGGP